MRGGQYEGWLPHLFVGNLLQVPACALVHRHRTAVAHINVAHKLCGTGSMRAGCHTSSSATSYRCHTLHVDLLHSFAGALHGLFMVWGHYSRWLTSTSFTSCQLLHRLAVFQHASPSVDRHEVISLQQAPLLTAHVCAEQDSGHCRRWPHRRSLCTHVCRGPQDGHRLL